MVTSARVMLGAFAALLAAVGRARVSGTECNVRARTDAGWVCGLARWAEDGAVYASFRGVPYATQPEGERRFKELEPPVPWEHMLDATEEGPICYQTDVIYGRIMQPHGMSEACIHANIHTPIEALPPAGGEAGAPTRPLDRRQQETSLLPVLVLIHGGGFMSGSGDADLHGPEYLVSKKVVVITFNYRLNVFGFLSLNSSEVPGNQGLRDQVTLLRWVQRNARAFGGDPQQVTIMGQSAGAVSAHLLTLSQASKGLFKRAFLMSGTAISGFYSPSPLYAQMMSSMLISQLGINSTDPGDVHRQLTTLPVQKINDAHKILLDRLGLVTFVPTVEADFPGVTRVLDDYPEALLAEGRGEDIPLVVGFTDVECEVFRPRLEQIDIESLIKENLLLNVPVNLIYTTPPDRLPTISKMVERRYHNGSIGTQGFIDYCTDGLYKYPALKLSEKRSSSGSAPLFLYQFSYSGLHSVLRSALALSYSGAAHIEDLTYVFRTNSMLGTHRSLPPANQDDRVKDWMTDIVTDFMDCGHPVCAAKNAWLSSASSRRLQFQDIREPVFHHRDLTTEQTHILEFFDSLT